MDKESLPSATELRVWSQTLLFTQRKKMKSAEEGEFEFIYATKLIIIAQ